MRIKIKKSNFYLLLLFILLGCILLLIPKCPNTLTGRVKQVIEGDLVELLDGRTVRYIGVNSPNIRQRLAGKWVTVSEPLSFEAKSFNQGLVQNKKIKLEFDSLQEDNFGNVLTYCFIKKDKKRIFVNSEILRNGFGFFTVSIPNIKYIDKFAAAQIEAFENRRGIWQNEKEISPEEARKYTGKRKYVEGKIVAAKENPDTLILLFHNWRRSFLKLVIPKKYADYFYSKEINPLTFYQGKKIRSFGLIDEYSGPEMAITHPAQIEIIE